MSVQFLRLNLYWRLLSYILTSIQHFASSIAIQLVDSCNSFLIYFWICDLRTGCLYKLSSAIHL